MSKTVVQVQVRAVLPTKEGCAVFLGNAEKVLESGCWRRRKISLLADSGQCA